MERMFMKYLACMLLVSLLALGPAWAQDDSTDASGSSADGSGSFPPRPLPPGPRPGPIYGGGLFGVGPSEAYQPPPLYTFDTSLRVEDTAYSPLFDRVLDTAVFENQTTRLDMGLCYGINLTTIDWFRMEARPRIQAVREEMQVAKASEGEIQRALREEPKRLRAYTADRERRREIAKRANQFQSDASAIGAAYTPEQWTEYIEAHPENRQDEIWKMYLSRINFAPEELFERIQSDLTDTLRGMALIAIYMSSESQRIEPPPPHPDDQKVMDEIAALEAELQARREALRQQQTTRYQEALRERWSDSAQGGQRQAGGAAFGPLGLGVPPGDPDQPIEQPFGGRGYPKIWGDSGHSLIPYRITKGTARRPDGELAQAYRVRFTDPNHQETNENRAESEERNYLLYFPEAKRWAISPQMANRWHGYSQENRKPVTYLDDRALYYEPIYEPAFVQARRISNERERDRSTEVSWSELEFDAPGERPDPNRRPAFDMPIPDAVPRGDGPELPKPVAPPLLDSVDFGDF